MPDMNAWIGSADPLAAWTADEDRAYDTARRIAERPSSIVVQRKSGNLNAQTVRIDPLDSTPMEGGGDNAATSDLRVLVTGYKGHPAVADTNLRRGDRFYYDGLMFTVTQIVAGMDSRLQAIAEVGE